MTNIIYKSPVGSMGNIANKLPTDIKLHDVVTQQYFQGLSNNFPASIQNLQDVIYYVSNTWYNEYFGLTDKEVNYPIVVDDVISITDTTNETQNTTQIDDDGQSIVSTTNETQNTTQIDDDGQSIVSTTNETQNNLIACFVKRYIVIGNINKNMLVENANVEINNEYDETEIKAILKNPDNLAKLIANAKIQEKILEVK